MSNPKSRKITNRSRLKKGALEKLWGDNNNIPKNIAALSIVLLLLAGILYTFFNSDSKSDIQRISVKDMWNIVNGLVTLAFGYLFADIRPRK